MEKVSISFMKDQGVEVARIDDFNPENYNDKYPNDKFGENEPNSKNETLTDDNHFNW